MLEITSVEVPCMCMALAAGGSTLLEEFSDVCHHYLGRWGHYLSVTFSLVALLGAAVVYWVLMANFLFHTGQFIYSE